MKVPGRKWRTTIYLMFGFAIASPAWAVQPQWPEGPYNYLVLDQDLRGVLEQFGRNVNIPVDVAGDVPPHQVRGKIGGPSAKAFLQWLCDSYQLVWYYDGAVLHVWPQKSVMSTTVLDLGAVTLDALKQKLAASGSLEERFPFQPMGESYASVTAPWLYVELVQQVLTSFSGRIKLAVEPEGTQKRVSQQPPGSPEQQSPADPPRGPSVITGIERVPSAAWSKAEASAPGSVPKSDQQLSTTIEKSSRPNEAPDEAEPESKSKVLVFRGGGTR